MQKDTNTNANKVKKWFKVVAWAVGIALFLFVGLFFFTIWLEHKIERMVVNQSKGVYRLEVYGLETSPFLGSLSVDSIALTPDYKRWKQLSDQGKEVPRTLLDLHTRAVTLVHLNFAKALFSQKVQLDELEVIQPKLLMSVMRPDTTEEHKPLHETKGFLQGLKIGEIDVNEASLHYRSGAGSDTLFSVRLFDLTVTDYRLDSASFMAKDRAYYAKKYKLAAADASYIFPDGLHRATSDSILINTGAGSILVKSIMLKPMVDPAELARAKGQAVTHQEIELEQLSLKGVDFNAHSRNNSVLIKYGLLQSPKLIAFKDKQHFKDEGSKALPHDMVQSIKTPFLIDSLELRNGYVRYSELVPEATERGHISFHKLNVHATNLSNIPEQISMEKPAVIKVSTMVMDRARFNVTARLPLLNKNGYHTLEGEIGEANFQILNPILVPTAFIKISRGHARSGRFKMELNKTRAKGTMTLLYDNLEVEMLRKGSGGEQGLVKKIISEIADWVAIKDSNPGEKGEKPRLGNINAKRNPQKSVFHYWKEAIASGFLSSIGLEGISER